MATITKAMFDYSTPVDSRIAPDKDLDFESGFDFEAGFDLETPSKIDLETPSKKTKAVKDFDIDAIISEASELHGVDPDLIRAVIKVESDGDPKAISSKKAKGLMQLIPETAKEMGVKNILDPRENVFGGTKYLAKQLKETDGNKTLALARYNAGPANVKKYKGVPPFPETQGYIKKVKAAYEELTGAPIDDRKIAPIDIDKEFDFEAYDPKEITGDFDFEGTGDINLGIPAEPEKVPAPDYGYSLAPADMAPEGSDMPELLGGALEIPSVEAGLEKGMKPVNKVLEKGANILDDTKQNIKDVAKIIKQHEPAPKKEFSDMPEFLEPVGEPRHMGAVLTAPMVPGEFLATQTAPITEIGAAEDIESKGGSVSDVGGSAMSELTQFLHDLPGPKKVRFKEGELKPAEAGEMVGRIMAETGMGFAGASAIFKTLGVGYDALTSSRLWRFFEPGKRQLVLQTGEDLVKSLESAGVEEKEILKALKKLGDKEAFRKYKAQAETKRGTGEKTTEEFLKEQAESIRRATLREQKAKAGKEPETKPVPVKPAEETKPKPTEPAATEEIKPKPPQLDEPKTALGKEVKAEIKEKKKPSPLAQLSSKEKEIKILSKPKELMTEAEKETVGKSVAKKFGVEYKGHWKDIDREMFNMDVGGGKVETFYAKDLNEDTVRKAVEATKKKWGISDRRLAIEAPKVERRVGERRDVALRKAVEEMSPEEKEFVIPELRRMNRKKVKEIASLKRKTITDPLTGLRNRQGVEKVLSRAEQAGKDAHYTFIDLIGFKGLNDKVGYTSGDKALEHIGAAMKALGLKGARTGGDEFGFVSSTSEKASANTEKLRQYFKENPVRVTDKDGNPYDLEVIFRDGTAKVDYSAKDIPGKTKAAQDLAEAKKATEPAEYKRGESHPGLKPIGKEPKAAPKVSEPLAGAAGSQEAPKVETLITKPVRDFAKKLKGDVAKRAEEMQGKVNAYKNWKWDVGDRVKSDKTGKAYKITGRLWDSKNDKPLYKYESVDGKEAGNFKAELAHDTLVKLGEKPSVVKSEIEKPKRRVEELKYKDYKGEKDLTAKSYVEHKGLKIAKQHKGLYNIVDKNNKTIGQYAGLQGAVDAIDSGSYTGRVAPKAAKVLKAGENIRTLRGFVKHIGKINPLNFKGEVKDLPKGAQFLFKSTGVPIDDAVRQLIDDGWLDKDATVASFLEDLRTNPELVRRDRIGRDVSEKKEFEKTPEEKKFEKESKWTPEEPPEGDYVTMAAADLPEGKKLTLIEGKTATGWDVYEVQESEPFGPVKLVDGQTIELKPGDKVQVLKSDLKKPSKKKADKKIETISPNGMYVDWNQTKVKEADGITATYYGTYDKKNAFSGWKTKAQIERIKAAKGKKTLDLDQGIYGKQRPSGMKKAAKAEQQSLGLKGTKTETEGLFKGFKGTTLYSGIPVHEFGKAAKALGDIYEKHVGEPIWKFFADKLPKAAGNRSKVIDAINKGIILDYNKDPDFIKLRDDALLQIELARKTAKKLADAIAKFPRAEQVRFSQVIQGSITSIPDRYKEAYEIIDHFKHLEKELQRLGILGPDNIFRQLSRKELGKKFKEVKAIDDKIVEFRKRLQPIIKRGKTIKRSSERTFEEVKNIIVETKTGTYKTDASKWTKLNEDRVREALTSRGFSVGEADQMIDRIKKSVIEVGSKEGTLKEVTTTLEKVVTKTITNEIERIKTFSRSYMARAKASILKDIKDAIAERNKILKRIQTHYKMSGKHYLRRAYKSIETEENFLARLMGYAKSRPRLKKGYNIQRKDLTQLYRTRLGEIKEAPYLVYKGLSEESHDMHLMELFNRIAENKKWAVSPEEWYNIMHVRSRAKDIAHYKDFKPLPMSDKLGKLSGAMVDPYIWDDLNQSVKATNEIMKVYDKLLNLWKIGKVPFNPATQFRNVLSNMILAYFAGLSPLRIDVYARAARDLLSKSGYWEEVENMTALFGKEWIGGEVEEFLNIVSKMKEDKSFIEQSADAIKSLLNKPLTVYQGIEQYFKLAVYIHQRELGATIEEAAKHAEEWIFNYQKVPPAIRWAKRWYSPFITFSYKAVPKFAETAVKRPWKIAIIGGMMFAVEEYTRRMYGESKEEVAREKKVLPDYMQKSILPGQLSHLRVPYKDKYKQSKYLDLSFILPWGDVAEQWGQSHLVGRPFLPSHPLYITIGEIAFNEVMFTGQELAAKDIDTGSEYLKKIGTQIWRQAAPSLVGSYSYNKLISAIHGERDWAMRERSVGEAVFDVFFGLKIRSIDYNEQLGRRVREYKDRIKVIRQRFSNDYEKIFIRNPTPDFEHDTQRYLKLLQKEDEQIQKIMDKITEITK